MPSLPYRTLARWGVPLDQADRATCRSAVQALLGAGFVALAVGGGLGVLAMLVTSGELSWIWWLATPGWILIAFAAFVSGDLSLHRDATGLPTASTLLIDHWIVSSLGFGIVWLAIGAWVLPWVVANP